AAGDAQTVTIAAEDGASGHVDLLRIDPDDEAALRAWLADDAVGKAVHDAKAVTHALSGRGLELAGVAVDIALAAYLVRPGQRSYGLIELYQRHLQRELPEVDAGEKQLSLLDEVDEAEVEQQHADSAATRARAVSELADRLDVELEQVHGARLLAEMELPLVPVLARMESHGIAVDRAALEDPRDGFADRGSQAAPGGAGRDARDAQDLADQDRVHHGRQGARGAAQQGDRRHPGPGLPRGAPAAPRGHQDAHHRRGADQDHCGRRPHPHHLQP